MAGLSVLAISSILEKMKSSADADYRFMALKDLHNELAKGGLDLGADTERRVGGVLLAFLTLAKPSPAATTAAAAGSFSSGQHSAELQDLVLRCVPLLVGCCRPAALEWVCAAACQQLMDTGAGVDVKHLATINANFDAAEYRAAVTRHRALLATALHSLVTAIRPATPSAAAAAAADATSAAAAAAVSAANGSGDAASSTLLGSVLSKVVPALLHFIAAPSTTTDVIGEVCGVFEAVLTAHGRTPAVALTTHAPLMAALMAFVGAPSAGASAASGAAVDRKQPAVALDRAALKQVVSCLGALAVCVSDAALERLVQSLVTDFQAFVSVGREYGLFVAVATLSKGCGARLTAAAGPLMRLLCAYAATASASANSAKAASGNGGSSSASAASMDPNELREHCLAAVEALVRHCPAGVAADLPQLLPVLKACVSYDPNVVGDGDGDNADGEADADAMDAAGSDDDAGGGGGGSDDEGGAASDSEFVAGQSDGDVDDDDDTSWKVRRAAARAIDGVLAALRALSTTASSAAAAPVGSSSSSAAAAVASAGPASPSAGVVGAAAVYQYQRYASVAHTVLTQLSPLLVSRFSERQEHVQLDVFRAFRELLAQARVAHAVSGVATPSTVAVTPAAIAKALLTGAIRAPPAGRRGAAKRYSAVALDVVEHGFGVLADALATLPVGAFDAVAATPLLTNAVAVLRAKPFAAQHRLNAQALVAAALVVRKCSPAALLPALRDVAQVAVEHTQPDAGRVATQAFVLCDQLMETAAALRLATAPAAPAAAGNAWYRLPVAPITGLDVRCGIEAALPHAAALNGAADAQAATSALAHMNGAFAAALYGRAIATLAHTNTEAAQKTRALTALGLLVDRMHFNAVDGGGGSAADAKAATGAVPVVLRGLDNPLTRAAAAQALARMARALPLLPTSVLLSTQLPGAVGQLSGLLRQSDPKLQHYALAALAALSERALTFHHSPLSSHTAPVGAPPALAALCHALLDVYPKLVAFLPAASTAAAADGASAQPHLWVAELDAVISALSAITRLCLSVDQRLTVARLTGTGSDAASTTANSVAAGLLRVLTHPHVSDALATAVTDFARLLSGVASAKPFDDAIAAALQTPAMSLATRRLLTRAQLACRIGLGAAAPAVDPSDTLCGWLGELQTRGSSADAKQSVALLCAAAGVAEIGSFVNLAAAKYAALKVDAVMLTAADDTKAQPNGGAAGAVPAAALSDVEVACAVAFGACAVAGQAAGKATAGTAALKPSTALWDALSKQLTAAAAAGAGASVHATSVLHAVREALDQARRATDAPAALRIQAECGAVLSALTALATGSTAALATECLTRLCLAFPDTALAAATALLDTPNATPAVWRWVLTAVRGFVESISAAAAGSSTAVSNGASTTGNSMAQPSLVRSHSTYANGAGAVSGAANGAGDGVVNVHDQPSAVTMAVAAADAKAAVEIAAGSGVSSAERALATVLPALLAGLTHSDLLGVGLDAVRLVDACVVHAPHTLRATIAAPLPALKAAAAAAGEPAPRSVIDALVALTAYRASCIAQVKLGPTTKLVDTARAVRAAALESLSALIDGCAPLAPHQLALMMTCIARVASGDAKDSDQQQLNYDVLLATHSLIAKIALTGQHHIATSGGGGGAGVSRAALCGVFDGLSATVRSTVSDSSVKEEHERHAELVRSAVRVAALFGPLPPALLTASANTSDADAAALAAAHQKLTSAIAALPAALSAPLVLQRQWSNDPLPVVPGTPLGADHKA